MKKFIVFVCFFIYSYAGWIQQNSGTTANLNDVFFPSDSLTGYICGDSGIILKTTNSGIDWVRQTTPVTTKLNAIYFIGDAGWCVGNSHTMLRTTDGGLNWEGDSGDSLNLYDIWLFNSSEILITGDRGRILTTTDSGRTWLIFWVGFNNALRNIFFINPELGWVVGDSKWCIKTYNGGETWSWSQIPYPIYSDLRGVYFINPDTGFVIGTFGLIGKTTDGGHIWETTTKLYSLYGIDFEDAGYICGQSGYIFKIPSGQETIINSSIDLFSINFPVSRVGWTVGSNGAIYKTSDGGAMIEEIHKKEAPSLIITPNPFTEYLTIRTKTATSVKIYDKAGNLIVDEILTTGHYRLNSKTLSKGVYFIKINQMITKVIKI